MNIDIHIEIYISTFHLCCTPQSILADPRGVSRLMDLLDGSTVYVIPYLALEVDSRYSLSGAWGGFAPVCTHHVRPATHVYCTDALLLSPHDSEFVRNEALLLLIQLTKSNPNVQKVRGLYWNCPGVLLGNQVEHGILHSTRFVHRLS